jgi:hypothetical protein
MLHFLYQLGVRPRVIDGIHLNPVVRFPPKNLDKFRYALSLGYHESANKDIRGVKVAQVVAATTNTELFEAALASVGVNYYYTIPVWLRLYHIYPYTPYRTSPEVLRRIIARGKIYSRDKTGSATSQEVHRLLDKVADIHGSFMGTMLDGSSEWPVERQILLHKSWKVLVSHIWSTASEEHYIGYPAGTKTGIGSLPRCYCPNMRWLWHRKLMNVLKTWLYQAHLCGSDTAAHRDRLISLFEMYALRSRRPWDCRWCEWCCWCWETRSNIPHPKLVFYPMYWSPFGGQLYFPFRPGESLLLCFTEFWAMVEEPECASAQPRLPGTWVE